MSTRPIVELDFDSIKTELIDFLKANPTFTDYNFEGSALNAIVDVLAYNTHYNAFYANMVHNEGFLDTAQARGSVVSKAKELGYVPRSVSCSTALIDILVNGVAPGTLSFVLERGTTFRAENDLGTFSFLVAKDYTVSKNGNVFSFKDVELKEGRLLSNSFTVDNIQNPRQIFTIPNKNVDNSTLKVFVRENISSVERVEYTLARDVFALESDSRIFFTQESYNGFVQIFFGDDVLGNKLESGNIIDISYIISEAPADPNGCSTFVLSGTIGPSQSISVTTTQPSFGGAAQESIDSIKYNAPKFFESRNRSVIASDYVSYLKAEFPFIKSVSVFGGQDADPPVYGKVFICIQPRTGLVLSDSIKNGVILPAVRKNMVLTIIPEILDPNYTFISLDIVVKFNRNKTTSTEQEVTDLIQIGVSEYFEENLENFSKDFLESALVSNLKNLDPGISSVAIKKVISTQVFPIVNLEQRYVLNFNNPITEGSLRSSLFFANISGTQKLCFIKDNPLKKTRVSVRGKDREFGALELYDSLQNYIRDVGTIEYRNENRLNSGNLELIFAVSNFPDATNLFVQFYAETEEDVLTSKNQILILDENTSNLFGLRQGLSLSLEAYER